MKKVIFIATLAIFFMAAPVISFAQESEEMKGSMMGRGMEASMKGKAKEGMMKMCPMHEMMKKMMSKEMVSTGDGGVIVMTGNKLMKFDKDLNLVKEVEIKIGVEGMTEMMEEMKGKCPMFEKMMGEGGMMEKGSMGGPKGSGTSDKMLGHESHH